MSGTEDSFAFTGPGALALGPVVGQQWWLAAGMLAVGVVAVGAARIAVRRRGRR